jgi:hypothetical protein
MLNALIAQMPPSYIQSFHNVTCYTNSLLSRVHVNIIELSNIMCTLAATCVILRSLECNIIDRILTLGKSGGGSIQRGESLALASTQCPCYNDYDPN